MMQTAISVFEGDRLLSFMTQQISQISCHSARALMCFKVWYPLMEMTVIVFLARMKVKYF